MDESRFIEVFRLCALQAGSVARYLQGKVTVEQKAGQGSPEAAALTAVDLATQDVILQALAAALPELAVDAEEDVAALDALVVVDQHIRHEAGHVRRDLDNVGADAAIARPRRIHVVGPQADADENGRGDRDRSEAKAADLGKERFHGKNSTER